MAIKEIVIDITALRDDIDVINIYEKCVRVVTGEEELRQVNLSEFSEYALFDLPDKVQDYCYYVKFVKGKDFITFLIDSGTLFLEAFRIMEGKFYLLGNNKLDEYKDALYEEIHKEQEGPELSNGLNWGLAGKSIIVKEKDNWNSNIIMKTSGDVSESGLNAFWEFVASSRQCFAWGMDEFEEDTGLNFRMQSLFDQIAGEVPFGKEDPMERVITPFPSPKLMDLPMDNLVDSNKVLQSWDASADPCTWFHVTCNSEKGVIRVDLGNANLSGQLVSQLGQLSNLQYLRLNNNTLTGTIPYSLTTISSLEVLCSDLSHNNLTGTIPVDGSFSLFTPISFDGNRLVNPPLSPPSLLPPASPQAASIAPGAIAGIVAVGDVLLFAGSLIVLVWWSKKKRHGQFFNVPAEEDAEVHLGQLKRFSLRELQVATDNFSNKNILGRGGFAKVYKGRLADGTLVAVNRLKEERTQGGELQFQTEIEMISMAVHRNLLQLRGFCMTPTERLLVYLYMSNGSVASCLRGTTPQIGNLRISRI
ncbi:hypothetical protein POM88_028297 [Heracleum sosnowskyi]|uniref:Protein kinase domain-containing protein n=1 Tax=Heracleum sosnowskyi TaxID=360622 RepID=A0AAD8IBU3_9APIA|nr:hypothetical protein POM88_028297 [Heracleum sosnowskyi]